jgi:hypothetical protein
MKYSIAFSILVSTIPLCAQEAQINDGTLSSKSISNFFEKITYEPDGITVTLKKPAVATVYKIDKGVTRESEQGRLVQLKSGQSITLIQRNERYQILFVMGEGLLGLVAHESTNTPRADTPPKIGTAKIDLSAGKLISSTPEENEKLINLANSSLKPKRPVKNGTKYQTVSPGEILSEFFETFEVSDETMKLQFKGSVGYNIYIDDEKVRRSKPNEIIILKPGQKINLVEKHGMLKLFTVKEADGVKVAMIDSRNLTSFGAGVTLRVAAGKLDAANKTISPLGEQGKSEFLESVGIMAKDRK